MLSTLTSEQIKQRLGEKGIDLETNDDDAGGFTLPLSALLPMTRLRVHKRRARFAPDQLLAVAEHILCTESSPYRIRL